MPTADLVIFAEEILNGKLRFLCSAEERLNFDLVSLYILSSEDHYEGISKNFQPANAGFFWQYRRVFIK